MRVVLAKRYRTTHSQPITGGAPGRPGRRSAPGLLPDRVNIASIAALARAAGSVGLAAATVAGIRSSPVHS